jgi:hypothetical protein
MRKHSMMHSYQHQAGGPMVAIPLICYLVTTVSDEKQEWGSWENDKDDHDTCCSLTTITNPSSADFG